MAIEWIKGHPYLAGGLALAVVVLIFALRSGGSSNTSASQTATVGGVSPTVQAAQVQASSQLQSQQISADVANNQIAADYSASQLAAGVANTQATLQAQVDLQKILTAGQVTLDADDTAYKTAQVQTGGQIAINQSNNDATVAVAGLQAQITKEQIDSATNQQNSINDLLSKIVSVFGGNSSNNSSTPTTRTNPTPITPVTVAPSHGTFNSGSGGNDGITPYPSVFSLDSFKGSTLGKR
jgi:ribosomal 50S subunit-recycling heat shock protein